MAIMQGDCLSCGARNVSVYEQTGICLVCTRLVSLEQKIAALERKLNLLMQEEE